MLSVEDWAEIRRLHRAEGMPIKAIARVLGVSRNTVRAALRSRRAAEVRAARRRGRSWMRSSRGSGSCCRRVPTMPATVIAERIGWDPVDPGAAGPGGRAAAGLSAAGSGVAGPAMWPGRSPSSTCGSRRSRCRSGSGRPARPTQLPVLTMVCGYSRWAVGGADPVPRRRRTCSPAGGSCSPALGAVPRVLVWDGEGAVGRWRGGRSRAHRRVPGASAAPWPRRC